MLLSIVNIFEILLLRTLLQNLVKIAKMTLQKKGCDASSKYDNDTLVFSFHLRRYFFLKFGHEERFEQNFYSWLVLKDATKATLLKGIDLIFISQPHKKNIEVGPIFVSSRQNIEVDPFSSRRTCHYFFPPKYQNEIHSRLSALKTRVLFLKEKGKLEN